MKSGKAKTHKRTPQRLRIAWAKPEQFKVPVPRDEKQRPRDIVDAMGPLGEHIKAGQSLMERLAIALKTQYPGTCLIAVEST